MYEYYHKTKLAEKKLLSHLNNFSNTSFEDATLETDKTLSNEESIVNFNNRYKLISFCYNHFFLYLIIGYFSNSQLEVNIKDEPLESTYEELSALYGDIRNENLLENCKLTSKYTQTDDVVIAFEKILNVNCSPKNDEKIEIKEEIISESPWDSPSRDDVLDSPDENDYSSEDNIALNKVLKIPPIKVRIKKEYSDVKKNKKSKKRKKEVVKKNKISTKESLIKKKRKIHSEDKSDESMKIEKSDDFENGLDKKEDSKIDDKNWPNPVISLVESTIWQCLTCFIFEKSRADLLQHYKDHVKFHKPFYFISFDQLHYSYHTLFIYRWNFLKSLYKI